IFEAIAQTVQRLEPLGRVFVVSEEFDKTSAARLLRDAFDGAAGKLIAPGKRQPADKPCRLFAKITEDRHRALTCVVADADKAAIKDLDKPICIGLRNCRLERIEPIGDSALKPRRKSRVWIRFR